MGMHNGKLRACGIQGDVESAAAAPRVNSISAIAMLSRGLPAIALFACLSMLAIPEAQAQSADECAAQTSAADEIACLRRALKEKTDALARTTPPSPLANRPTEVAPAIAQPARPQPAQAGVAAPRAVPNVAPNPAPSATPAPAADLGREQLASSKRDGSVTARNGVQAVVLSAREDREGLLRLTLENGQVWKQSDRPSTQIMLRDEQKYPVEIAQSGFGGYRMYFPGLRRTIVVKRIL